MDKELIEKFAGKKIKIILKSNLRYTGSILNSYSTSFEFNDRFIGVLGILYEDVERVEEVGE